MVWDLGNFAGRYLELYADQDFWFGFAASAADALVVSGEVAASTKPVAQGDSTQTIGRPVLARTVRPVFVNPKYPFLQVRAQVTSTGLFLATPAGGETAVYR